MCELLAMASRYPATLTSSLERFARRGGEAGPHADGWGLAHYDGFDVRLIREPERAADSRWVPFIRSQQSPTRLAIAHIRKATVGVRQLANTQPFIRELGGRIHVFAHNGDLDAIDRGWRAHLDDYQPVGTTDSEIAFCALMTQMKPLWRAARRSGRSAPEIAPRREVVAAFAADLRRYGPANFLYSDGELLFAHGHRRKKPDGGIRPPGMVTLSRRCGPDDGRLIDPPHGPSADRQEVTLISSVPLTAEDWQPLQAGELAMLRLDARTEAVS
jgi:glutamine amidotransferase